MENEERTFACWNISTIYPTYGFGSASKYTYLKQREERRREEQRR